MRVAAANRIEDRFGLEELSALLVLLFFGMAGAIPGIAPNQANEMTGAQASGLMFFAGVGSQVVVNLIILVLALRHAPRLFAGVRSLHFAGLLAGFALISSAWSQDPTLTARRAIPFALATLFGLYLATRHPLRRQLALFETAFALLALGSVVLALGFPALGLDASNGHAGNWQGVFTQKNACGRAMVFATAVVLARGRLRPGSWVALTLFVLVLGASGSRGAWVIEALLIALMLAHAALSHVAAHSRGWLAGTLVTAAALVVVVSKVYFAAIAAALGRDPTLTGRTAIWAQVWLSILKRPWLGYGFSAFWRGAKGASFQVVVALKFVLFHAHNGFLEIWLELGAVGLALFALSYLRGWWRVLPGLWVRGADGFPPAAWPLAVLILIAAYDFDENTLLSFNGLFWVLYVHALSTIELTAAAARQRLDAPAAAASQTFPTGLQPEVRWS